MADESLRLNIAQRQQQTLSPMQLQLVRMLEMNAPEVEDEVRRAIADNPALEVVDEDAPPSATPDSIVNTGSDIPYYRLAANNYSPDDIDSELIPVASGESLMEAIMSQLSEEADLSAADMEVASFLAGNLDANGYLTRSVRDLVDDIAIQSGIEVSEEKVRQIWQLIRTLDPAGIGAVDLRDCLLLQLQRRQPNPDVDLATEIVRDYFDVFSLMHFDRLRSFTDADAGQLKRAIDVIRTLNPKPGAQIEGADDSRTRHITPDFLVEADGDMLTLYLLNSIPRLQIEQSFTPSSAPLRKDRGTEAANAFIRQKRDEATGFIKVLETRQRTLFRVMSAIMQWQRDFFLTDDPLTIRPMILRDIAGITGDDMSVVSRATAGKYVATRQGVYPLKLFFNEPRKESADSSAQKVLDALRRIIESEDKRHPLSDAAITSALQAEGFDIARRTVTKYRERLGLPVGRLRRSI